MQFTAGIPRGTQSIFIIRYRWLSTPGNSKGCIVGYSLTWHFLLSVHFPFVFIHLLRRSEANDISRKTCTNPAPLNGGKYRVGRATETGYHTLSINNHKLYRVVSLQLESRQLWVKKFKIYIVYLYIYINCMHSLIELSISHNSATFLSSFLGGLPWRSRFTLSQLSTDTQRCI